MSVRPGHLYAATLGLVLATVGCESAPTSFGAWPLAPRVPVRLSAGAMEIEQEGASSGERLVIADFNGSGHLTNAGTAFGGWDSDPGDKTQSCRVRLIESERLGDTGFGLMLDYDVESPNPAFNGFWMKLPDLRLNRFAAVSFSIKGDAGRGFTKRMWLELKQGPSRVGRYLFDGITADWQRVSIPLRDFDGIATVKTANEFVIVFDDQTVTGLTGVLYLDDVAFEPAGG